MILTEKNGLRILTPKSSRYIINIKGTDIYSEKIYLGKNATLDDYEEIDKLTLEGNQLLLVEKRHNHKEYEVKGDEKIEDILSKYNLSPLQFLKLNEKKILKPGEEIIVEE